jgi:hypothetical protein
VYPAGQRRIAVRSTGPWGAIKPHSYLASLLVAYPKILWSDGPLKSRQLVYHSEIHDSLSYKVRSSPGGTQACGHSTPWDMEDFASSEEWIPLI